MLENKYPVEGLENIYKNNRNVAFSLHWNLFDYNVTNRKLEIWKHTPFYVNEQNEREKLQFLVSWVNILKYLFNDSMFLPVTADQQTS